MTITVPAIIFNFYTRFFSSRECLTKGFRKSQQKANLQDNKRAREAAEPYILKRCDNRGEFLHRRGRDDSEDVITMDLIIISSSGSNETRESSGCSGRGGGFSVSAGGQKSRLRRSRRKNAGQKETNRLYFSPPSQVHIETDVSTQKQFKNPLQTIMADYD